MKRYNPAEIEPYWQDKWHKSKIYKAVDFDQKPKYYLLTEFPYPSGIGMHIGHMREYTYGDILSRYKRNKGYNVLYPIGFDSFGLPTENYAIKNKISPVKATEDNIANFRVQLNKMGFSFDWDREVNTADPDYYKWTQWLFLEFFKAGLAYQKEISVNWCPFCKTGLSNEEVVNSRHERCDTLVEKKIIKQWLLKITAYADRLIDGLRDVDYSPRIAEQQINWIGMSKGAEISFKLAKTIDAGDNSIKVFTTRADTIFGATFLVLAPEHPLVHSLTSVGQKAKVDEYLSETAHKTELDRISQTKNKTGVFLGSHVINPATLTEIPVWIADYVLPNYGTGAIMAVPGHDQRDFEFAKKHQLPIVQVVKHVGKTNEALDQAYSGPGIMINSGKYNSLKSTDFKYKIVGELAKDGTAKEVTNYKLRDWIFSRQHYWGEPIPIIHCPEHGPVPVPDKDLPLKLPEVKVYEPTSDGKSPLSQISDWVNTTCPICHKPAMRETDTMPNWAGSSWYYLRYMDPKNDQAFVGQKQLNYWKNVDLYIGGMEHVTLHLLYSRFWHQFLYDQKLVVTKEPYEARRGQGIILAADHTKMSKSKGNIVDPLEIINSGYGADALRLTVVFLAPYDLTTPWSPETLAGCYRFLSRLWTLVYSYIEASPKLSKVALENSNLDQVIHRLVAKITSDINNMNFNTAVASLMDSLNQLYKIRAQDNFSSQNWAEVIKKFLVVLSPFAPHIAEELWRTLGNDQSVQLADWPTFDPKYLQNKEIVLPVQINGKLRDQLSVGIDLSQDEVMSLIHKQPKLAKYLEGHVVNKVIYVPNKIVNLLIS